MSNTIPIAWFVRTGALDSLLLTRAASPEELALMRRIGELRLDRSFAGARMLVRRLKREGCPVGRRRVSTLMARMGIYALYSKPNTSRRHPAHRIYPYLLRNQFITRSNPVWAADITYIPMRRGFVYLSGWKTGNFIR